MGRGDGAPPAADRLALHLERVSRLPSLRRRLYGCASVGALLASAAELARAELGFDRALVVSLEGSKLTANVTDPLSDEASDRLRRKLLAEPVELRHDTREAELVRRVRPGGGSSSATPSLLAHALELRHFVLAPVAAENRTLAVLLVDRTDADIEPLDSVEVDAVADVVAGALAYVVLRARQQELASDLRYFMASTQALLGEMLDTPIALPTGAGDRPAFPLVRAMAPRSADRLAQVLSESEMRIASQLVLGRSNREIAEELILSRETVKAHVARILRKLGAANRVEAVATILHLGQPP